MVRNRRATTGVALTRRVARTVTVEPSPAEQALYVELPEFLRQGCRQGAEITRMMAQTLQMELGSSPRAAAVTLERLLTGTRRGPPLRDSLRRFREQARAIVDDAKSRALLSLVRAWPDKLQPGPERGWAWQRARWERPRRPGRPALSARRSPNGFRTDSWVPVGGGPDRMGGCRTTAGR
jgi:hypothetical protein